MKSGKRGKNRNSNNNTLTRCTVVIRVEVGTTSITTVLKTCVECGVSDVIIVDEAHSPSSPIYVEERAKESLLALKEKGTRVSNVIALEGKSVTNDIVIEVPTDCYMTKGCFDKQIEILKKEYKRYDQFSVACTTFIKDSYWNGLVFLLFIFDWFRALFNRFKLHQRNTHVIFKVVRRRLGNAEIPSDKWFWRGSSKKSYSYGGRGCYLLPEKSGMDYFLIQCGTHSYIGIVAWIVFLFPYSLFVGFPWYNWMPILNYALGTSEILSGARLSVWIIHFGISIILINKYFATTSSSNKERWVTYQWIHVLLIPLWMFPLFPLMLVYGKFIHRSYREPFKLPSTSSLLPRKEKREEGDSDGDDDDTDGVTSSSPRHEVSNTRDLSSIIK